jgi:hypothetical protein
MTKTFYKLIFIHMLLIFPVFLLVSEDLRIDVVADEQVTAKKLNLQDSDAYIVNKIFDVYEDVASIGNKRIFINFVDSVYLKSVEENQLVFNYIWEGEKEYIKNGYYLAPTSRIYKIDEKKVQPVIGDSSLVDNPDYVQLYIFGGGAVLFSSKTLHRETGTVEDSMYFGGSGVVDILLITNFYYGLRSSFTFHHYYGTFSCDLLGEVTIPVLPLFRIYGTAGLGWEIIDNHRYGSIIIATLGGGCNFGLSFIHQSIASMYGELTVLYKTATVFQEDSHSSDYTSFSIKIGYRFF